MLDPAYTDDPLLVERLEVILHASLRPVTVRKVDLVNDTTTAEVRFELPDVGVRRAPR